LHNSDVARFRKKMDRERSDGGPDPLSSRLDELGHYQTHTPFSQLFCRLIVAWSWEAGADGAGLRKACLRFLDAELWYHQRLAALSDRDSVSYEDLRSLADKRRINLTALSESIHGSDFEGGRANVVRHLLLAECHYHLRETEKVVEELEKAIESGGGHPLVHFALGYNRFDRARDLYAEAQSSEVLDAQRRATEFQQLCLSAADAFRDGLTGQVFDAQLHLWIGRALAAAGHTDEAEAALETAARIDPSIFGKQLVVDESGQDDEIVPASAEHEVEEGEQNAGLPPISEEEVRLAGKLLQRKWRPDEVLGGEDEP
jgi:tetratricopeptide (TPR) repeat protein